MFDPGIEAALDDRANLDAGTFEFGRALEHWIFHELRSYRSYHQTHWPITFWRSKAGQEVDFCVGDRIAIEVKSTERLTKRHFRGLKALREEDVFKP